MSTLLFYALALVPFIVLGAIGEALAIALGYIDPWDMK